MGKKKNQCFKINTCDIQLLNAQVPLPSFTCVAQILFRNNKLFPNLEGEGVKDKIYFMHKSHVTVKYTISIMMSLNQNLKIIMNAIIRNRGPGFGPTVKLVLVLKSFEQGDMEMSTKITNRAGQTRNATRPSPQN